MSTTKITERNLDEKFLQNLYTKDNPPTASNVGAVAESELATAIQSLIDSGVIEVGEKAYTPSSNLIATVLDSEKSGTISAYEVLYIGKWIPNKSGAVIIGVNIKGSFASSDYGFYACSESDHFIGSGYSTEKIFKKVQNSFEHSVAGAKLTGILSSNYNMAHFAHFLPIESTSNYIEGKLVLKVDKGVPVYFAFSHPYINPSSMTCYCNSIKIYADEV